MCFFYIGLRNVNHFDWIGSFSLEMVLTVKENQITVDIRLMVGITGIMEKNLPNAMRFAGECFIQAKINTRGIPPRWTLIKLK